MSGKLFLSFGEVVKLAKITLIGDSITEYNYRAAQNWPIYISKRLGCDVQNLGISGTGFVKSNPYLYRINNIAMDTDLIGVACSFNDLNTDYPIGEHHSLNENSICSMANFFFKTIKSKFPNVQIICYIQNIWYNCRPGFPESDKFVYEINEICNIHNIPFYRGMYTNDGLLRPWLLDNQKKFFTSDNYEFQDVGTVDNIHPNSEGHKVIADYLCNIIKDYI